MRFKYDDGGRYESGRYYAPKGGDCFTRAVCIAGDLDYATTHKRASWFGRLFGGDADWGVPAFGVGGFMRRLGFSKVEPCPTLINDPVFDKGRYVVFARIVGKRVFGIIPMGHAYAVVNGTIYDIFNPMRIVSGIKIRQVWRKDET